MTSCRVEEEHSCRWSSTCQSPGTRGTKTPSRQQKEGGGLESQSKGREGTQHHQEAKRLDPKSMKDCRWSLTGSDQFWKYSHCCMGGKRAEGGASVGARSTVRSPKERC